MAKATSPKKATRPRKRGYGVSRAVADTEAMESWLITALGGRATASGEMVTHASAMGLAAYYAAISNISEDLAKLPLPVYRKLDRGREQVPGHPAYRVLNESPNEAMTPIAFRESMNQRAMGNGNAYAEIEWSGRGDVMALMPLEPQWCVLKSSDSGSLYLRVSEPGKGTRDIPYRNVFHIRGRGSGVEGVSVARAGSESIGRAMAAQAFSAAFFGNGAHLGTVLEHPGRLSPASKDNLRDSLNKSHAGAPNAFKTYVLEEGMKLASGKFGIPPEEAQLLEVMQFTVEDVARWFRCPLSKIQYFLRAQGWSTLELLNTDYVIDTLMPYDVRWTQEIQKKLLLDTGLYARHNFMGLLRGDATSRAAFYTSMFRLGVLNRNEIRELEEQNEVPGGETYYIEASNLAPLGDDGLPVMPEPEPVPEPEGDATVTDALSVASVVMPDKLEQSEASLREVAASIEARIKRKERKAIEASAKKRSGEEFEAWLVEFYAGIESEMEQSMRPIVVALDTLHGCDNPGQAWKASDYCQQRIERFRNGVPEGYSWGDTDESAN